MTNTYLDAKANRYVRAIRNPEKKRYAQDVLNYIIHSDYSYLDQSYNLGAMAKQAVHINLCEIYPFGLR